MSAEKKIIGARFREAREYSPYWTRGEMARLLRDKATPEQLPHIAHIKDLTDMIKQWEAGKWIPRPRYRTLYCRLLGRTEAELFGVEGDAASPARFGSRSSRAGRSARSHRRHRWRASGFGSRRRSFRACPCPASGR